MSDEYSDELPAFGKPPIGVHGKRIRLTAIKATDTFDFLVSIWLYHSLLEIPQCISYSRHLRGLSDLRDPSWRLDFGWISMCDDCTLP
jgi:hypothetical protein